MHIRNIGEQIDDSAEGDAKTDSAHGSRAYAISVATASGHSRRAIRPTSQEIAAGRSSCGRHAFGVTIDRSS